MNAANEGRWNSGFTLITNASVNAGASAPGQSVSFGNSGPVPLDYIDFFKFASSGPGEFYDFRFGSSPWRYMFREMRGELEDWFGGPSVSLTFAHPMEAVGMFRSRVSTS